MRHLSFTLAGLAFACGSLVAVDAHARPLSEKVTDRVVEAAIESGLEALTRPENQRRLGQILSSPAVTGGVHDIAFALVDGVFDSLDGRMKFDLDSVAFWKGFDSAVRRHVGPAVGSITRNALDAAMEAALTEENGAKVEALAAHASFGVMKGLARGIREELAPALAYSIEHELAPAGASALEHHVMPAAARGLTDPNMQIAIAMTMSSVARSLVRGGDAGIETAKAEASAGGQEGTVKLFGDRLSLGLNVGLIVVGAVTALLIFLAVLLVRSARAQQRLAEQGKQREDELLALIEQGDTQEAGADTPNLRESLLHHLRSRPSPSPTRRSRP